MQKKILQTFKGLIRLKGMWIDPQINSFKFERSIFEKIKFHILDLSRDVVALSKTGGARLYWAPFPGKNWGGPKYFLL